MKKIIVLGILVLMSLAFAGVAYAVNCGGTTACSCGNTLNESRTLNASDSLTGCSINGLTIGANNIVLDCAGQSISSDEMCEEMGAGIFMSSKNNVTIKNCNIQNSCLGIFLSSSSNNTLANNTVSNNLGTAITLNSNSNNNSFTNNTINSNGETGIYLSSSSNNTLTNNSLASNWGGGIGLTSNSNYNLLKYNNVYSNNHGNFLSISNSIGNNVTRNYWGYAGQGICSNKGKIGGVNFNNYYSAIEPFLNDTYPTGSEEYCPLFCGANIINDITIEADIGNLDCSSAGKNGLNIGASNIVVDCGGYSIKGDGTNYYGVNLTGFNNVTVKNCNITDFEEGIYLEQSSNNILSSNIANSNYYYGIFLYNSANNNLIINNTASDNTEGYMFQEPAGIFIWSSLNNNLASNIANSNRNYGIHLNSASNNSLTNNTANNNGNTGVVLYSSNNNILTGNSLSNTVQDIWMESGTSGNRIYSNTVGTAYPTTFSVTQYSSSGNVNIKAVTSPEADPSGKLNISRYIKISGPSWLYLNLNYSQSDVTGITESSLRVYHYNSTDWEVVSGSTVDTGNNVISANLTAFSDFGGFGDPTPAPSVPEFSDYALVLIVLTAIGGFYFVKKKK